MSGQLAEISLTLKTILLQVTEMCIMLLVLDNYDNNVKFNILITSLK